MIHGGRGKYRMKAMKEVILTETSSSFLLLSPSLEHTHFWGISLVLIEKSVCEALPR